MPGPNGLAQELGEGNETGAGGKSTPGALPPRHLRRRAGQDNGRGDSELLGVLVLWDPGTEFFGAWRRNR